MWGRASIFFLAKPITGVRGVPGRYWGIKYLHVGAPAASLHSNGTTNFLSTGICSRYILNNFKVFWCLVYFLATEIVFSGRPPLGRTLKFTRMVYYGEWNLDKLGVWVCECLYDYPCSDTSCIANVQKASERFPELHAENQGKQTTKANNETRNS